MMIDGQERAASYDPMIYDAMRELATRLGGRYLTLERLAKSDAEKARWRQRRQALDEEVHGVDVYSEIAVRDKTDDLARRLEILRR